MEKAALRTIQKYLGLVAFVRDTEPWNYMDPGNYKGVVSDHHAALHPGWYRHWVGTALIIRRKSDSIPGKTILYAITARHVIAGLAPGRHPVLRIGLETGESRNLPSALEQWHWDEDPSIDIAVLPFALSDDDPPILALSSDEFVSDSSEVGVGDQVFITGMFARQPGMARNLPLLLTGIIASMPEEPILTNLIEDKMTGLTAYLVQAYSEGGFSGSPVYVAENETRLDANVTTPDANRGFRLLGLLHGSFGPSRPRVLRKLPNDNDDPIVRMPAHIYSLTQLVIVIPADQIFAVLQQDRIMELVNSHDIPTLEPVDADPDEASEFIDLRDLPEYDASRDDIPFTL